MFRSVAVAVAALAATLPFCPPAAAAEAHWLCALSEDAVRLVCVVDALPQPTAEPAPAPTAVVNGTGFPLDARRQYTVELWSPPTDLAFVEQLARATICYRSPGCQVTLAPLREQRVALRR